MIAPLSIVGIFVRSAEFSLLLVGFSIPMSGYVVVSLWFVGHANRAVHHIDRTSLLWSWLSFLGSATRSGLALVVATALGAIIGSVLASKAPEPIAPLRTAAYFLVVALGVWLIFVILIWTIRAVVDTWGREKELKENLLIWLEERKYKRVETLGSFLEDGSSKFFIILIGLVLMLVVVGGVAAAGSVLVVRSGG